MTTRTEYRQIFEAMLTGDTETANRLNAEAGKVAWQDSGLLVLAAFALGVERQFAEDASHDAIKAFVTEAQQNFAQAPTPVRPLTAEAVIRGILGEEELLDEVPREAQHATRMMLTYKMVQALELTPEEVGKLLDEAEDDVDHWVTDE